MKLLPVLHAKKIIMLTNLREWSFARKKTSITSQKSPIVRFTDKLRLLLLNLSVQSASMECIGTEPPKHAHILALM